MLFLFMLRLKSTTPRWVIVLGDLFIALFSLGLSYLIRFDLEADTKLIQKEWEILSQSILIYFLVKFLVFYLFRIHKGIIRHTSSEDIRRIFLASLSCSLVFVVLGVVRWKFWDGYFLFPNSVLIMEFLISFFTLLSFRFAIKYMYLESKKESQQEKKNILIYGAGVSGLVTKRTIEKDVRTGYQLIAFVDDNRKLNGSRIEGIQIYHTSRLLELIRQKDIELLIMAIQEPQEQHKKQILEICLEAGVEVRQVPSPKSWINGEFTTKQISKLQIEDLLGRNPIQLNADQIRQELKGQVVLVTGASGSIGSGLVKEIANYQPGKLVLLDQAESPIYELEYMLRNDFPTLDYEVVIGDIRVKKRMKRLFDAYGPKYVFHAAAYKHVPLMEDNPSEAVNTNVRGTVNLVDLSLEYEVEKFVMISTDKAVNPTNVMGASKRIAEMYAQASKGGKTRFITTRFGNVLGSNGSVIPLFEKQIAQGGPITVTDERITRYFMTIPEACQLVLEAANMGEGGEIFVFDMGDSVRIVDLAKKMIKLSGLVLGKDIEIKIIGLRPGEKLFEELLAHEENTAPTHHPQILIARVRQVDEVTRGKILELIDLFDLQDNYTLVAKMKEIVPEYISNNSEFTSLDQ
ncbi:MAG: polysaccharide biosynthesis protein [Bacteroidetes bacterium]|nr:MAG: polysaccharide biosynthesis protein [Bacteroidota bacterium]